jgi:hypothetical protein
MVVFVVAISACVQLNPLKPKTGLNGPPGEFWWSMGGCDGHRGPSTPPPEAAAVGMTSRGWVAGWREL